MIIAKKSFRKFILVYESFIIVNYSQMKNDRSKQLKKIRNEIWNLDKSPLYKYRRKNNYYPVIGEGDHFAKIMFIGEAPGKNEAETGRPFCGAAGKILDQLLDSIGIKRKDVYITNIVKDRPPENRDPADEEIELYAPFLERQIDIIKPKVIATLGRFSMKYILGMFDLPEAWFSISQNHGKLLEAPASYGKVYILPLYHPAVGIYRATMLDSMKKDMEKLKKVIDKK